MANHLTPEELSKELGIKVEAFVGTNFVAVIEGMGSKQVDIGFLNPLSYVMASNDYGVKPILKSVRGTSFQYRAQLTVRKEDNIPVCDATKDKTCKATFDALKGKNLAFVDPASTSGYLFPASFMKGAGVDVETGQFLPDVILAGGHDTAVKAVVLPRTAEQRDAIRGAALPSLVVPEHAIDAQSLIALADLVVSAGGTMNREAVALGTPVLTTGRAPGCG